MSIVAEISAPAAAPPQFTELESASNGNQLTAPRTFRWTKTEYQKLAELGFFAGRRTELVEGEIVEMPTMNTPHATALSLTDDCLRAVFSSGYVVRNQMPLDFGDDLELVPDIAILAGKARDFAAEHPKTAALVVEVADTTLRHDRTRKARLYAENQIPEYWIVNIPERCVEIYRRPNGKKYTEIFVFDEAAIIAPLAQPEAAIKAADLLP